MRGTDVADGGGARDDVLGLAVVFEAGEEARLLEREPGGLAVVRDEEGGGGRGTATKRRKQGEGD